MAEKEWKPEPVAPSSLIQVGGTTFSSMRSAADLASAEASAPTWHRAALNAIKAQGKVREETQFTEDGQTVIIPRRPKAIFCTGARAIDRTYRKKVTIIQCKAGYTKKTKTPVHKVVDKAGNVWLAKQTDLELLP